MQLPAEQRPKRSVLFLSVTAEEKGLLGSRYYAQNPLYPLNEYARQHQHGRRQPVRSHERHRSPSGSEHQLSMTSAPKWREAKVAK